MGRNPSFLFFLFLQGLPQGKYVRWFFLSLLFLPTQCLFYEKTRPERYEINVIKRISLKTVIPLILIHQVDYKNFLGFPFLLNLRF